MEVSTTTVFCSKSPVFFVFFVFISISWSPSFGVFFLWLCVLSMHLKLSRAQDRPGAASSIPLVAPCKQRRWTASKVAFRRSAPASVSLAVWDCKVPKTAHCASRREVDHHTNMRPIPSHVAPTQQQCNKTKTGNPSAKFPKGRKHTT